MKYLSGINGFKWHVPLKSFMPLKETRTYLTDLTDLTDLSGKPRGGLARVPAVFFQKWHEIFKWHKRFKWHGPFKPSVPFKKCGNI